jgi:hypothetical protein
MAMASCPDAVEVGGEKQTANKNCQARNIMVEKGQKGATSGWPPRRPGFGVRLMVADIE